MSSFFLILAQYGYDTGYYSSGVHDATYYGDNSLLIGYLLIGACALLSFFVHMKMESAVKKHSATRAPLSGAETAARMLASHGLSDVRITCVKGKLTDHYNPLDRTVNLSEAVYHDASVASMAVAAHECGHAVQHAAAYPWMGLRSAMVPMVNFGATIGQWVLMAGIVLLMMSGEPTVAWIGLALFATAALFALVTLPVEFDASRRALAWLERSDYGSAAMHAQARSALRWAAMTYVAAALSALANVAYYALIILSRSNRNRR